MINKNTIFFYLATFAFLLTFTACSETDDETSEFEDWQNKNETYFNNIYSQAETAIQNGSTDWKIFTNWSFNEDIATDADDHIVVKVLQAGTGSGCPMYSDSVMVHYRGRLIPSKTYSDGYVFDESYEGTFNENTALPSKFVTSGLVDGFATALQNMHIGDNWEVYIPYQLGYGTTTNSSIPAYSTLIFDIQLAGYSRAGSSLPVWN